MNRIEYIEEELRKLKERVEELERMVQKIETRYKNDIYQKMREEDEKKNKK